MRDSDIGYRRIGTRLGLEVISESAQFSFDSSSIPKSSLTDMMIVEVQYTFIRVIVISQEMRRINFFQGRSKSYQSAR